MSSPGIDGLSLVGLSHRTAPFEALERLALQPHEVDAVYDKLAVAGVEAVVLSTCNRTEAYGFSPSGAVDAGRALAQALREVVGAERFPEAAHIYQAQGLDGARHLFRVACGLDSMFLGEAQILGQLKEAYEQGARRAPPGPAFDRLLQSAFRVGARTRSETEIGRGAVSIASAAVHLATRVYGDLSDRTVAVVGAGQTGRLVAQHLAAQQPRRILILNRTLARAAVLAREVQGEPLPLAELPAVLHSAHVVACAVQSAEPIIDAELLRAVDHNREEALALLDLGLPRNVAPQVETTNVFVHDLTALQHMVDANLARRRKAVPEVERLIDEELQKVIDWQRQAQAGPLITALRDAVEGVRLAEVERATKGLSAAERAAVDRATRAVVNKLLHGPTVSIKEAAKDAQDERLRVIQDVFRHLRSDGD